MSKPRTVANFPKMKDRRKARRIRKFRRYVTGALGISQTYRSIKQQRYYYDRYMAGVSAVASGVAAAAAAMGALAAAANAASDRITGLQQALCDHEDTVEINGGRRCLDCEHVAADPTLVIS
ncbi:hypothetical protein [Herbiconiux sp. VKM Ac-2851]|uniref:hypothetical protein n=1 Tax=Herbiconiux sp. VKM Ac-2851 TaxID=2739025 RepID=UPI0015646347|nr:hypothetical protein [Herbiconiux sp. VKM Ac-2851]NQX36279.1 hypothetical protein [Herbiconiux sp. VKM Ac-2851]